MQCTAGSTVKAGAPTIFQFDSVTVSNFLPFGAAIAWLGFISLPAGPVYTADFCSREPPATTMSALDWTALADPPIALVTGAYSRFSDWIQQQAFSQYCACNPTSATPYATQIVGLSPIWYWKLGESSGIVAADSSGNGHAGGYSGTETFGQAALMLGDAATSVHFTSGIVYTTVLNLGDRWNGAADQSMEFWTKITAAPASQSQLYTTYTGTDPFVSIEMAPDGKIRLQVRDAAATLINTPYTSVSLADNAVHQYDLVLDHTAHTLTLYIDGVSAVVAAGLSTNFYSELATDHWYMQGPHQGSPYLNAYVGHISMFGHKLSATDISDNKAAAGAVGHYNPPVYTPPSGGTPPAGSPPVCATSQDICNQLYQTNLLLQGVSIQLSNFKSRALPSFWITGAIHTGVTGTGVLTVSDILGVNVILTAVPLSWGSTMETPPRWIPSTGSIQFGTAGEYTDNAQVHYSNEIIMAPTPWASQVRYNLRTGVTATIVELKPGT